MAPPLKVNPEFAKLLHAARENAAYRLRIKKREVESSCKLCKKDFKKTREWQKYCSDSCKNADHAMSALDERQTLLDKLIELESERDDLLIKVEKLEKRIKELEAQ